MGKLETDRVKLRGRLQIVRRIAKQSVSKLLLDLERLGFRPRRAGLVVGSLIEPASIANLHIRAHAFEGELFRTVLVRALNVHKISSLVTTERELFAMSARRLNRPAEKLRLALEKLGHSAGGPWRTEQRLSALAAWSSMAR